MLRLWHFYERLRGSLSRSRLGKALEQKFLSLQRYREWSDIVRQLKEMLHTAGFKVGAAHISLPELNIEQMQEEAAGEADAAKKRGRTQDVGQSRPKISAKDRPTGYDDIHQSLLTGLLSVSVRWATIVSIKVRTTPPLHSGPVRFIPTHAEMDHGCRSLGNHAALRSDSS